MRKVWPLCLYFLLFSGYFALANPPLEAPDEPDHLNYVSFVARELSLPNQYNELQSVPNEGHQYPLYYILAAAAPKLLTGDHSVDVQPIPNALSSFHGGSENHLPTLVGVVFPEPSDRTAFYALRLMNCLIGAVTVLVVGLIGLLVLPRAWWWPPLLVAALPQFQFICGSISNDPLAALTAAVATLHILRALREPTAKAWVWAGLWVGLAVLAKKSNLVLVPALAIAPWLGSDVVASKLRESLISVGTAAAVMIPLIGRNWVLYREVLGTQMEHATTSHLLQPKAVTSPYFFTDLPHGLAFSFYAHFGWMNVPVADIAWKLFWVLLLIPLVLSIKQARQLEVRPEAVLSLIVCVSTLAGLIYYNLSYTQYQGRLLFPLLAALAFLWGIGMSRVSEHKVVRWSMPALLIGLNLLATATHWRFYGETSSA